MTVDLYCQGPVQLHGALPTNGNRIVNQHGNSVSFAGYSFFWSNNNWGGEHFYNASTVHWLARDWKANIIRAAMGVDDNGGYLSDSLNKQKNRTISDAAIQEDIYVIY